jgi:hypothetical protein
MQGFKFVYQMVNFISLQLLENKIIGHRESHRLVFTVKAETWNMGKILKKVGDTT